MAVKTKKGKYECKKCGGIKITEKMKLNSDYTCGGCRYKENPTRSLNSHYKSIKAIPAGVYAVYYKGKIVYVGESAIPYKRFSAHIHSQGPNAQWDKLSSVQQWKIENNIKKKDITFELLEEIEDKETRLEVEKYYISLYNPKLNNNGE